MTPKPPYFVAASRVWIGEKPPQTSPDYPRCPRCGGESEVAMHRHIDSDGAFHEAVFQCRSCGARQPGDEVYFSGEG